MNGLLDDIRYAVRRLRASPLFTGVVILTLGLGLGASSAIFSVVNGVLLSPLPYRAADRLVLIWERATPLQLPRMWVSYPNFLDWRERNRVFEEISVFGAGESGLTGAGEPEPVRIAWTTRQLFDVMRVRPVLGRSFTAEEDAVGGPPVVVIGDGLWQRRFGRDPNVVGRVVRFDGDPYTVIGVMPPGFAFGDPEGERVEAWVTLGPILEADPESLRRDNHWLTAVARLRPGVTPEAARSEMMRVARELRAENPESFDDGIDLVSLEDEIVGGARRPLLVLLGAVGVLLLVACANVANLLLARSLGRTRELSVRVALGAGRGRLVRQLLTESLLLSLAGGLLGLLTARWGVDALLALSPESLPRIETVGLDARVLAFAFVTSLAVGILFGLAPALQAARLAPGEALKQGGRVRGEGAAGLRRALVVTEVGLALVLLVGAGLLIRSFQQVLNVDPGYDPAGVLFVELTLPQSQYPDAARQSAFFEQVLERVQGLAGVRAASVATDPPLRGSGRQLGLRIQGIVDPPPGELAPLADIQSVSPGYFASLGIPLRRGRDFTAQDAGDAPPVAVVDETVARRWFPKGQPTGRRIAVGTDEKDQPIWREVVGVAAAIRRGAPEAESRILVYVPFVQDAKNQATLVVRTGGDPALAAEAVRRSVRQVDGSLPIGEVRTLGGLMAHSLAPRRLMTVLLAGFAGAALLLAALGTYGLMAQSVTRRVPEIGIRMALGARAADVLRLVLKQGMLVAGGGIAVGLVAALALTRVLARLLYDVSPTDPATFAAVALVLGAVALVACYVPARRASRTDPMQALRYE